MPTWYCGAKDCLGHSHPDHNCDLKYVTRKLYVYKFKGAPLIQVYAHASSAVRIWREAGIQFLISYIDIGDKQAVQLIGKDLTLQVYVGPLDKYDEPGYTERRNLYRLKRPGALAVFFLRTDGPTMADIDLFQAYIGNDVAGARPGRTVAHEIGHLLLGKGHTGDAGCGITSGLMYAGNQPGGHLDDISKEDAEKARIRASKIPIV